MADSDNHRAKAKGLLVSLEHDYSSVWLSIQMVSWLDSWFGLGVQRSGASEPTAEMTDGTAETVGRAEGPRGGTAASHGPPHPTLASRTI